MFAKGAREADQNPRCLVASRAEATNPGYQAQAEFHCSTERISR